MTEIQKSFTSGKIDIMDTILFVKGVKPIDKLVAIALIQHLSSHKHYCWPSEKRIAKLVGDVSISTVKRSIRRLVEIGWFSRTRRYNTSNVYKWMGGGNLLRVHKEMKAYKKADDETEASHPNGSAATPPRVRAEPYEGSAVPPPPVRDDPLTPLRTPEGTPEGTRYDASAVADAPTTRVRDTTAADEWLRRRHGKSR